MKRVLALFFVAALLLAIPVSHQLLGKGHVPGHKTQFCHNGNVVEVGAAAAGAHLAHGDSPLPADSFCCIYHKGDACDNSAPCPHNPVPTKCDL